MGKIKNKKCPQSPTNSQTFYLSHSY